MMTTKKWATGYRGIWHLVTAMQADGSAETAACGALVRSHKAYDKPQAKPASGGAGGSLALVGPRACRACKAVA